MFFFAYYFDYFLSRRRTLENQCTIINVHCFSNSFPFVELELLSIDGHVVDTMFQIVSSPLRFRFECEYGDRNKWP